MFLKSPRVYTVMGFNNQVQIQLAGGGGITSVLGYWLEKDPIQHIAFVSIDSESALPDVYTILFL
jgi:hypothetical protein